MLSTPVFMSFAGGSDGEESACNAGELGSIPGLERSPEGGTHSSILAWRISMDRGAWRAIVHGVAKSRTRLNDFHFLILTLVWSDRAIYRYLW